MTIGLGNHPYAHGISTPQKLAQVVDVVSDKDVDGKPSFRVKVRVIGDQSDTVRVPDSALQYARITVDPTSKGGTPYLKPGMQVWVEDRGGSAGFHNALYVTSIDGYKPLDLERGDGFKAASETAQPREETNQYPYKYRNGQTDPVQVTKTEDSREPDCCYQKTDKNPKTEVFPNKKNRWNQSQVFT